MKFICPHCASVIVCADSDCGGRTQCPDCLHGVNVPASRGDPGAVIGDFVIRELIGSGGMGTVYRAEQLSLLRSAALKVLHPALAASPVQLSRFLKEARIAASMNHPNLVSVYAVGEEDGLHYLAMELVRGKSVQDVIRARGRLPLDQAAEIILQVAAGLSAAWKKRNIVHCDVKPENILLPDEGGVKIADLGLAERGGTASERGDESGTFGGSPYYVCPEVILGKPLDHRSDLYSLGVTFFEMLTGHLPFEGTELAEVAGLHLYAPPPDPRKLAPDIPAGIADIIMRLLSKAPDERFQSAEELIQAVRVQVLLRTAPELAVDSAQGQAGLGASRWQCPACGRTNSDAARYCLGCGAYGRIPCPLCGEEVLLNAQHCGHCGGNLAEQRQGVVRQAESLLARMDECIGKDDLAGTCRLVSEYRALDQSVLPELVRAQFNDVVAHVATLFEVQVQEARSNLQIDRLEQATVALYTTVGAEQYQWLKDEVDRLKSDLAQTVFHAGSALKSNCPSTCQKLLEGTILWKGGSLATRLHELRKQCAEQLALREHSVKEAHAALDSAEPDLHDAMQSLRDVSLCRVTPKIMVLPPDESDTKADQELGTLAEALQKVVHARVQQWVKEGRWGRLAELAEAIRNSEDASLLPVERAVTTQFTDEVQERYRAALTAERLQDLGNAWTCWNRVLEIPQALLPRQVRREALAFPSRRSKLLTEQRRPLLKSSLSAVFFLWCLAFCLTMIEFVVRWFDETWSFADVRTHAIPLVVQLAAIALLPKLLRNPRVLSADDPLPGCQPALFLIGLKLLWIMSPLNGVFASLCARAGMLAETGQLPESIAPLAAPWVAPALVTLFWLIGDMRLGWRYRSPLAAFGMTISWLMALGAVYLLWDIPPDTPLLQVAAAMYQAIAFAALQVVNYLWFRRYRQSPAPRAEPAASAG